MVGFSRKLVISLLLVALIGLSLLTACDDDDGDDGGNGVSPTPPPYTEITIGNLSDLTGVSSNAMVYINLALEDAVAYYNDNNLIPGVKLKVVTYDGQMDPSRDIPGYEWLLQRGADLIFTPIPAVAVTLKSRADRDEVPLFTAATNEDGFLPPGWVFLLGIDPKVDGYTILKWIAENDWDYKTKGPAKVGGAAWSESYSDELLAAMKHYCSLHPDQFEWMGGYLTDFSFQWAAEVEALKDCDYVYPGIVMFSFVKEYRRAGCTGKIVGTDTQAAFFEMISDAELWEEIDGMLFLRYSRWWNDEGEVINLIKEIIDTYHPGESEKVMASGVGYLTMNQIFAMLEIVGDAAEAVEPRNIDSQALYDAAKSYLMMGDGVKRISFGEEKRDGVDTFQMYEARATEENIFRLQEGWFPAVRTP